MQDADGLFLGIDFSGDAQQWAERCSNPSVWIATLATDGQDRPRLIELLPVQDLPGHGSPFDRLTGKLRAGGFIAAAIDAPFSIPTRFLPEGGQPALLDRVARLPVEGKRPFARGWDLVELAHAIAAPQRAKPYRDTELRAGRGINTRSTLWNGARGGAPFTIACLTLLARADRPVWPWRGGPGLLVEAFPAAQLKHWGLPHSGYARPAQSEPRVQILDALRARLRFDKRQHRTMLDRADALDAVLAAFGGIAAARAVLPTDPPADGLIAVMADHGGLVEHLALSQEEADRR